MTLPPDALTRFTGRADSYAAHRPSYPAPAIDAILDGLPDPSTLTAADIGAGTGIAARLLAARGLCVLAVEPNDSMRSAGIAPPCDAITWIDATAESTGLPDCSTDLVLCAQSFHWLAPDRALAEFRRILRPASVLALLWNIQDLTDAATAQYNALLIDHATEPPRSPSFANRTPRPLDSAPGWTPQQIVSFPNHQSLDKDGLVGRALSASYCPTTGPERAAVVRALGDLFDAHSHDGRIVLRYETEVHLAHLN